MLEAVNKTIKTHALITPGDGVVAALSGGADSVALLAVLRKIRDTQATRKEAPIRLFAVHVNHGLRDGAARDEAFVRELCAGWDIPLRVAHPPVRAEAAQTKKGIEETARRLRYAALCEAAADYGADKIATGHNADDNAETVLLNICRGAGLRGLGGIAPKRDMPGHGSNRLTLIRPLIEIARCDIEAYLQAEALSYATDETNSSSDYARNRMRHVIFPALHANINPRAALNIARNALFLRADAHYLDMAAQRAREECLLPAASPAVLVSLSIPRLRAQHEALRTRIIRLAIAEARARVVPPGDTAAEADINALHIHTALDIAAGQSGREGHLPWVTVRRNFDALLFMTRQGCTPRPGYDTLKNTSSVIRTRRPGDWLTLPGPGGTVYTKKLKDYFIGKKVPRHARDTIRLLAEGSHVLKIMDIIGGDPMPQPLKETVEILITAEQINDRVQAIADQIIQDYGDEPLVLLCALTGGVIFMTDLSRRLGTNALMDFLRATSYGDGTITSGKVRLDCLPKRNLEGIHVVLVEDIIDTGHTLVHLKSYLMTQNPASLRVCALLDKPSRREVEVSADYLGFTIPDQFVVGYGLDYAQRYRNLPYVGVLKFTD